jgi:hypothetical protein
MDDDVRYASACKIALAVGAGVNWTGALLFLLNGRYEATWEYSPRLIKAIAQVVGAVLGA